MHMVLLNSLYTDWTRKKISEIIWGHKVKNKGHILNNVKWQNKRCQHVGLGQTCKSLHGDVFVRPTVQGSKVKKVKFQTTSNGKTNDAHILAVVKHAKGHIWGHMDQKSIFTKKRYKPSMLHSMTIRIIHVYKLETFYLCCGSQVKQGSVDVIGVKSLFWCPLL